MRRKIVSVCIALTMVIGMGVMAKADESFDYVQAGETVALAIELISDKSDANVIYKNTDIVVTDVDIQKKMIGLRLAKQNAKTSIDEKTLKEQAFESVVTTKMLLEMSENAGYTVSDAEYEKYKNEMRDALAIAENGEEMQAFFNSMGGIEKYFILMEDDIKGSMQIGKFLDEMMYAYAKEEGKDPRSIEFFEEWKINEKQFKADLYGSLNITSQEKESALELVEVGTIEK